VRLPLKRGSLDPAEGTELPSVSFATFCTLGLA
jgi:hypothetical protein